MRAACDMGVDAVGQRLFMRAVGEHRVEVCVAPAGEDAEAATMKCAVDLTTGMSIPL
jgi:hypothetical protein